MRVASILSIVIVSLAVPAFADDDEADFKKQMDLMTTTYVEGFNKRDPAAMVARYTSNAIVVNSRGLQTDLVKYAEGVLKAGFDHVEITVDQSSRLGPDTAIGTGQSHYTGKNQSGAPIEASAYWTATYVREGGIWKVRMLSGIPMRPPAK